jgi:ATP-dependent helicase/nuclease subunit B
MTVTLHRLPLADPALAGVARWLLERRPGPGSADLVSSLVLLPSSRACAQLGHALLEEAGAEALLLPRILTPARLADHLAELMGLDEAALPEAALRPLILAPRLAALPWLAERPEAAPGLAAELIALFDEVRLARREAWILEGRDDAALRRAAGAGADEVLDGDLARVREAWRIYRALVPRDQVDRRVDALRRAASAWPGERPSLVAAAHLARLDAVMVALLRGLDVQEVPVHWLAVAAEDPRSRLLLASHRDAAAPSHPLAGLRLLAEKITDRLPEAPVFTGADLPTRLAELGPAREELGPDGPLRLLACRDPEHESRVVAARVCAALAEAGPVPEVLVATPDRDLAARIAAQLRDAGVDVDDSRGRPLGGLPGGRLLRLLLRTVTAGWPFGPLFELLTHPYVRLVSADARPAHAVRVQLLEVAVRRAGTAGRGLPALRRIARGDDGTAGEHRRGWSLEALVDQLEAALAPVSGLAAGRSTWTEAVPVLRAAWTALAPDRPLDGDPDPRQDHDDVGAVAGLLGALEQAAPHLAPAGLAEVAAAVESLLADSALEVRPHRQRHLPVRLVGLVEARLEAVDHLFLAGLAQDLFPGRLARPLFLGDGVRRALDLAHWRARAARDGELFLRLLHAAPRVTITWPTEREGQPCLPSPLVQRLAMVAAEEPAIPGEPPLFRRQLPDLAAIAAREDAFRAEPEPVPAPAVPRPARLSHSSLQRYRDCPYRFLLADALGLRRPDPLEPDFTAADHGTLAHAVMQAWLAPGGEGTRALAAGDGAAAAAALEQAAAEARRGLMRDLPGGDVALRSVLALTRALVDGEIDRHRRWRPVALEAAFSLTLGEAADWLAARGEEPPPLGAAQRSTILHGVIDRIDRDLTAADRTVVIDYKTSQRPTRRQVVEGRSLQVHLYALAVAVGGVEALGAPAIVDHGGFYGLRGDSLGLPKTPHLADADELAAGVRAIVAKAAAILDPGHPFALVPDWQQDDATGQLPCRYCEFRGLCRLEERDATPALTARLTKLLVADRGGRP